MTDADGMTTARSRTRASSSTKRMGVVFRNQLNGPAYNAAARIGVWKHRHPGSSLDLDRTGFIGGSTLRLLKCSTALRAQPAGVFKQRRSHKNIYSLHLLVGNIPLLCEILRIT